VYSRRAFTIGAASSLIGVSLSSAKEGKLAKPSGGKPNLCSFSAAQVLAEMRSGNLTAEVYVSALLARLDECARLNLTTWTSSQKALEHARAVDRARKRGAMLGPMAGLPILVKDNIDTVGFPTSAGTAALEKYYPEKNAPIVQRLLDAGAFVLAKTNMHELASGGTSSNALFGPVRNPYQPDHIAGGSSGGTAAAIAAGVGTVGLGTDTAGSVRIPSAFCGVVGFRPSLAKDGREDGKRWNPYEASGVVPLARDLDTVGPIGRTLDDLILLDEVITSRLVPPLTAIAGRRLGFAADQWQDLDPDVERGCRAAVQRLVDAGAQLVEVDLRGIHEEAMALFSVLITAGNKLDLGDFLSRHVPGSSMKNVMAQVRSADVRYWFDKAAHASLSTTELDEARHHRRAELITRYRGVFSDNRLDAIVCPTEPVVAPPIRARGDRFDDTLTIAGQTVSAPFAYIRNTAATCVLGAPGLTIPIGLGNSGLPMGLELDAIPGADSRLLALGRVVQSILGPCPPPHTARDAVEASLSRHEGLLP
jgi:indoleacetamide hydrolase